MSPKLLAALLGVFAVLFLTVPTGSVEAICKKSPLPGPFSCGRGGGGTAHVCVLNPMSGEGTVTFVTDTGNVHTVTHKNGCPPGTTTVSTFTTQCAIGTDTTSVIVTEGVPSSSSTTSVSDNTTAGPWTAIDATR